MAKKTTSVPERNRSRTKLRQADVPASLLEEALRIPRAIHENYAGRPTSPLRVASAMNSQPTSGSFRRLCGSAVAYGLTEGSFSADKIKLTQLGTRITRPTVEDDDLLAKREALLRPRVISEFLSQYNGNSIPKDSIAQNVLNDMGVPADRTSEVLDRIIKCAEPLGLITKIHGKRYVDLESCEPRDTQSESEQKDQISMVDSQEDVPTDTKGAVVGHIQSPDTRPIDSQNTRRVFITHGRNHAFIEPIKKLLSFGEMEAVVSVEKQSVSQPVPDKVMNEMRSCGAAIIHVEDEMKLLDSEANEHIVLNPNVLIEIGAAMALYGKRFILLVKSGVKLPSNLQGLFEVRYEGDSLGGPATMKLLEAINEMKKQTLDK